MNFAAVTWGFSEIPDRLAIASIDDLACRCDDELSIAEKLGDREITENVLRNWRSLLRE